jgi:hypothetical protein
MSINYIYKKINEDQSKTLLSLTERWALFQTWLAAQSAEDRAEYIASAARNKAMLEGYDLTVAVHPPVDPVWKAYWSRFLTDAGVEQTMEDAA